MPEKPTLVSLAADLVASETRLTGVLERIGVVETRLTGVLERIDKVVPPVKKEPPISPNPKMSDLLKSNAEAGLAVEQESTLKTFGNIKAAAAALPENQE